MNSEKNWRGGRLTHWAALEDPKAAIPTTQSRACNLLSAAWSSPAVCAGRSAAALQPRGQAAGPRRASVPHTASPFPGENITRSKDSTAWPNKGRDCARRAPSSGAFLLSYLAVVHWLHSPWSCHTSTCHRPRMCPALAVKWQGTRQTWWASSLNGHMITGQCWRVKWLLSEEVGKASIIEFLPKHE